MNNEIISAFANAGIRPPPEIILDGKLHRFPCDDRDKKKSGWLVGFNNVTSNGENFSVVVGGSLKTGEEVHYQSNGVKLDKHDKARVVEQMKKGQERRDEEKRRANEEAAKEAQHIWENSTADFIESKYLALKKIDGFKSCFQGVRFRKEIGGAKVIVPMVDTDGKMWGLQTLGDDGSKFFMQGQRVEGTFHQLGPSIKESNEIYLCEGFATGVTIYEAIKKTVIVTFNSGNLVHVAKSLFHKYPDKAFVICGDDDRWHEDGRNAGREKGERAAESCVGKTIFPSFENEESKPTDFNDLYTIVGLEAVRIQILEIKPEAHFVTALGYDEGDYYVFSNVNLQVQKLSASALSSASGLLRLQPRSYWENIYPGPKDSIKWTDAADDIMQRCHAVGIFKPDNIRGTGAWMDQGRPVFHCGNSLFHGGKYYPLSGSFKTRYMYNFDAATARMDAEPLSDEELLNFANALEFGSWKRPESGPILAAWLLLAPISGALDWRSHLWMTGPTGTGKSWIMDNVCHRVLRGYATFTQGETTEAGIRQNQRSRSLPIITDEFETNDKYSSDRVKSILQLARQASSDTEAVVLKGSTQGDAIQYRPRFAILASSVRVNMVHEEDLNRFTLLEVERRDNQTEFRKLEAWVNSMPNDFGQRMARTAFEQLPTIIHNARVFHKIIGKKFTMRFGQQWGTICAGLALIKAPRVKFTDELADTFVSNMVKAGVFESAAPNKDDQDERKALDYLLHDKMEVVDFRGDRVKMAILEVIRSTQGGTDFSQQLEREGLKVEGDNVYIITNYEPIRKRYASTKWSGGYAKAISRLPGSSNNNQKWFTIFRKNYKCLGVSVPTELS